LENKTEKIFLVDGHSYAYRSFYALPRFTTSKGMVTNAAFGFARMLLNILDQKPDYLAVAFDSREETFRRKKYAEYKIERPKMPDELSAQLPLIKKILDGFKISYFEAPGYEGDDLLATIAIRAAKKGMNVVILTGDKDMLQLVGPDISVMSAHKEDLIYDEKKIAEKYGVDPGKIVDLMALMGDSSDNIPGVPGVGEKTASELLHKFGTFENLYSQIKKVTPEKLREKLVAFKKQAELSRELATVDCDAKIEINWGKCRVSAIPGEDVRRIFAELEFKSLLKEISPGAQPAAPKPVRQPQISVMNISNLDQAGRLFKEIQRKKFCAMAGDDTGLAFALVEGTVYFCNDKFIQALKPVFSDTKITKYGHDIKKLILRLNRLNIQFTGPVFDLMIADYLINPIRGSHELATISEDCTGHAAEPGPGPSAEAVLRIKPVLDGKLKEMELSRLFENVEMPLVSVLSEMELTGIIVDLAVLRGLEVFLGKRLEELTRKIHGLAGHEFNINSPSQIAKILFQELKLPAGKKGKTGYSTSVEILEALAVNHELPSLILDFRKVNKLKTGYAEALPELVNSKTGRIHTSFNQTVTATGRLSSSNPNLQNIPVKTELGRQIRKAFVPVKGWKFLSADYSQIDLRMLTHLSEQPDLIRAFEKDEDIHSVTAAGLFGVGPEDVTPEQRRVAKTVNFGLIYGMSPFGLSRELKISRQEAQEFIDGYFQKYPGIRQFMDSTIVSARKTGTVRTILNRYRPVPGIADSNPNVRQAGERIAINFPVQGSASDLMKVAMVNIHAEMKKKNMQSRMLLQVHDELLFETPEKELADLEKIVVTAMETAMKLNVKLKVSVKTGNNWDEAH